MTSLASEISVSELRGRETNAVLEPGLCPVCGQPGAKEWLKAPDRFHGRRELYTLLRCPTCTLVWTDQPPRPEEMHLHYTEAYDRLISAAGENSPHRWRARNAALTPHVQSGVLLDLGCSSGAFLSTLKGGSWQLHGVEMSAESAKLAEARSGAKIFVGHIPDARFAPGMFDVITCFDVFEHLYEPRLIISKVAEWLKPGGIFYVLVPNIDSAEMKAFGSYWHGLELPRHLFHYSPRSLKYLADAAGLETVSLETRRNAAIDTSLRYVIEQSLRPVGIQLTPVAYRKDATLPWRVARKAARMTFFRALRAMAPLLGEGESIHAIFRKGSAKS